MKQIFKFIQQEPLIHFALPAILIFATYRILVPQEKEQITVSQQTIQALINNHSYLLNRPLTESEKSEVIEEFINEEILIREAQKQKLAQTNTTIRKMLIDQMRIIFDEEPLEPTRADLENLINQNPEKYQPSQIINLEQVFYRLNSPKLPSNSDAILNQLRQGKNFQNMGDNSLMGNTLNGYSEAELKGMFGLEFTRQVLDLNLNEWSKPIESNQGTHFVRVTQKQTPPRSNFATLEPYLRETWKFNKRREIQAKKVKELRQNYQIKIEQ